MKYVYIQQNSSLGAGIKYPSSAHPSATIATSGCGVCSSLMALMNLTKYKFSLKNWTSKLIKADCRAAEGTNMVRVCEFMQKNYGLKYSLSTKTDDVIKCIKKGGGVIANVGGRGYFSSSGHFVYVAGVRSDGRLIVLDPYYYSTKWTSTINGIDRAEYFKYYPSTHETVCKPNVLAADRAGYFYLLTPTKRVKKSDDKKGDKTKAKYKTGNYILLSDMIVRTGAGTDKAAKKVKNLTKDGRLHAADKNPNAIAVLKTGTTVTAEKIIKKGTEYWMKIPSGYVCLEKDGRIYARKSKE